jgi:hypothetical protein
MKNTDWSVIDVIENDDGTNDMIVRDGEGRLFKLKNCYPSAIVFPENTMEADADMRFTMKYDRDKKLEGDENGDNIS